MQSEPHVSQGLMSLKSLAMAPYPWRENTIAFSAGGAVDGAALQRLVDDRRCVIQRLESRFVLIHTDVGHELLACLLAAWSLNCVPVLASRNILAHKSLSLATTVAEDTQISEAGFVNDASLNGSDTALVLYTSGSSGTPVALPKTFAQLDVELAILEVCWGSRVSGSLFASTVSRQHMFGLPFALLWPFARGDAFYSETIHYIQSLPALCQRFSLTLISSPVQLDNLPDDLDWSRLKSGLATIFSAGAPLPDAAAQQCREKLLPVTEIYGSTETGAVAWRDRTINLRWQCLPGISVAADGGRLRVHSPCLGMDGALTVPDRAEVFDSERFSLQGRVDRIAKVGGKRISLTEVENNLVTHPWVKEARALLLDGRKSRVGAVVVLGAEGRAVLIDQGRKAINHMLSAHLYPNLEPVAIPRYWRYVGRLPQSPEGKTTNLLLQSLFHPDQQPRLPEVLEEQVVTEGSEVSLVLRIPDNLFCFSGHFPGSPVLPGVVQLSWVQLFAARYFAGFGSFRRLEKLKFQQIIQPGDLVTLALSWQAEKQHLKFSFNAFETRHSSGLIAYGNGNE